MRDHVDWHARELDTGGRDHVLAPRQGAWQVDVREHVWEEPAQGTNVLFAVVQQRTTLAVRPRPTAHGELAHAVLLGGLDPVETEQREGSEQAVPARSLSSVGQVAKLDEEVEQSDRNGPA